CARQRPQPLIRRSQPRIDFDHPIRLTKHDIDTDIAAQSRDDFDCPECNPSSTLRQFWRQRDHAPAVVEAAIIRKLLSRRGESDDLSGPDQKRRACCLARHESLEQQLTLPALAPRGYYARRQILSIQHQKSSLRPGPPARFANGWPIPAWGFIVSRKSD